jgi:hypothetical protein
MLTALIATQRGSVERYYTCPRCGARGEVEFTAHGTSTGGGSMLAWLFGLWRFRRLGDFGSSGNPQDDADAEQRKDADRILALIRCPACHKRPPGAFFWPALRIAGLGVLGLIAVSIRLHLMGVPWWLGGAVLAGFGLIVEIRRFGRAQKFATLKLAPGAAALPEARVYDRITDAPSSPVRALAERVPIEPMIETAIAPVVAPIARPAVIAPPTQPAPLAPGAEPSMLGKPD